MKKVRLAMAYDSSARSYIHICK